MIGFGIYVLQVRPGCLVADGPDNAVGFNFLLGQAAYGNYALALRNAFQAGVDAKAQHGQANQQGNTDAHNAGTALRGRDVFFGHDRMIFKVIHQWQI